MIVSYFNNAKDNVPKDYSLHEWLKSNMYGFNDAMLSIIHNFRETGDKSLKQQLPAVTISAQFKNVRKLNDNFKKTSLITLDVDQKENPCLDMQKAKKYFSRHPSTLFVALSVSGKGIFVIIRINNEIELNKYFKYFFKTLRSKGIIIDMQCTDYTRLRYLSYDTQAYYNPNATVFNLPTKTKVVPQSTITSYNDLNKVNAIIQLIQNHKIDITSIYSDWVKIGASLSSTFGEQGRTMFHGISNLHPEYSELKTNRKFDSCSKIHNVSLSTLFYIADSYGIRYKK